MQNVHLVAGAAFVLLVVVGVAVMIVKRRSSGSTSKPKREPIIRRLPETELKASGWRIKSAPKSIPGGVRVQIEASDFRYPKVHEAGEGDPDFAMWRDALPGDELRWVIEVNVFVLRNITQRKEGPEAALLTTPVGAPAST